VICLRGRDRLAFHRSSICALVLIVSIRLEGAACRKQVWLRECFQREFYSSGRQTSFAANFKGRHRLHADHPPVNGVAGDFCQHPAFSPGQDRNRYRETCKSAMIIDSKTVLQESADGFACCTASSRTYSSVSIESAFLSHRMALILGKRSANPLA
jgi:hypothetical protein